jgi:hypothetical protein
MPCHGILVVMGIERDGGGCVMCVGCGKRGASLGGVNEQSLNRANPGARKTNEVNEKDKIVINR